MADYWTIYATVFRDYSALARKVRDSIDRRHCEQVLWRLKHANLVYLPTEQVDAIPPVGATYLDEGRALAYQRAPFPVTFLAIGGRWQDMTQDWIATPLYAALLYQEKDCCYVIPCHWALPTAQFTWRSAAGIGAGQATDKGVEAGWAFSGHNGDEAVKCVAGGVTKALRSLFLLESVNVELRPGVPAPVHHRGQGIPSHEVIIRTPTRSNHDPTKQTVDWSHRWEVRGHFKHYRRGPIYETNPDRRIERDGDSYVRIWTPPFVKGPSDLPLIPKVRIKGG